jgi:hypothetical protein
MQGMRIQNESFWEISKQCVLNSRFRFGDGGFVTKFVYQPEERVLVLGCGREYPTHKALISSYACKKRTDTSHWVRGIVLREKELIYYRQGVQNPQWYDQTSEMLRFHGLPGTYRVVWGREAKHNLQEDLEGFP